MQCNKQYSQYGFTKERCAICVTSVLPFLEEVYDKLDGGYGCDVVHLHIVKTFDKVPNI